MTTNLLLTVGLTAAGWHPAAWREPGARPGELLTARWWIDQVVEAQEAVIDLVTIEDALALQSSDPDGPDDRTDATRGYLDAIVLAARIAPATRGIGIAPVVTTTLTEPFHVSTQIATIDYVSGGRAAWLARVAPSHWEAAHAGRRGLPSREVLRAEAAEHVEVVRRLWDSWEVGAEIRDAERHRFVDRSKLHHIDFAGERFRIRGPSITPRPPQGQPVVLATEPGLGADLVLEDLVVFLDDDAPPRPARRAAPARAGGRRLHRHAGGARRRARGATAHPAAARRHPARPARDHARAGPRAAGQGPDAPLLRCWDAARAPRARPPRQPVRRMTSKRQIHLAAHFPGVNNTTVWSDPASGSHIDFASFVHLAQIAERAKFDFFFLAEGLSLREHAGHVHDLDVVGRPESFTILAALAAVTERIGLMATLTATYHEPYELARALGTLDHLSDGRAGWNLVTSTDALTGRNFSRGGYLDYGDRYVRGRELLESATQLWHSWAPGDLVADPASGRFLARPDAGAFAFHGEQVDIEGRFTLPRSPQGRPVVIQAGDSDDGREFAAEHADGIFTRHGGLEAGRAFFADVKSRMLAYGREPGELLILPGVTFVLGDTDEDAREQAEIVRRQQVSGPTAMVFLEQLWNRDLSEYDPDGPLPDVDPIEGESTIAPGSIPARSFTGRRQATADEWRAEATAENLSIRDLMVRRAARQTFVGSAATIADQLDLHVQTHACDGFILVPHITPAGLDRFADEVVPLLQERGSFRTEYEGTTLREHLGLAQPWPGAG